MKSINTWRHMHYTYWIMSYLWYLNDKRGLLRSSWSQWFGEQSKLYLDFLWSDSLKSSICLMLFSVCKHWGWCWSCRDIVMLMRESSNLSGSVQRAILSLASAERSAKSRCVPLFILYQLSPLRISISSAHSAIYTRLQARRNNV